jgi:starch synthase
VKSSSPNCHHLFVDHPSFRRAGIYGDSNGAYGDNLFRFALLSRAGIEAAALVPLFGAPASNGGPASLEEARFPLGEDVVFHVNDWHTALVPLYLEALYRPAGRFRRAGTVLGIHNAGHQGNFAAHQFPGLDISSRWWPQLDMNGELNLLKTGAVLADKLIAVSPNYAREICGELGFGLGGIFSARGRDLLGIVNGVGEDWNPATDPHIAANFSADDLSGKAICKSALQRELGLAARDVPILAVIARLDPQKGVDLLMQALPWLMQHDLQLVILGSGNKALEQQMREMEWTYPDKARGWVGFNEALAHRIEAGADLFLMPSRFEPCGLNQIYSMRYGTVPVVHATGGLADTVETLDPSRDRGTGWAFRHFDVQPFIDALGWSLLTWWRFPDAWRAMQQRGMRSDWSWERSAERYEAVYAEVLSLRA